MLFFYSYIDHCDEWKKLSMAITGKVLIYKSCSELSLLVQLTIHCVFLTYFDPNKYLWESGIAILFLNILSEIFTLVPLEKKLILPKISTWVHKTESEAIDGSYLPQIIHILNKYNTWKQKFTVFTLLCYQLLSAN